MVPANVKLSKNELSLVCNEAFILTKNNIIDKVYNLFGLVASEFSAILQTNTGILPPEILRLSPKIYRGEQYRLLPYVMLDCPRYFNKPDIFAIRCFFWWGNFFSITLHLNGNYTKLYSPGITDALYRHQINNWYYCTNTDQWQHHFYADNYTAFTQDTSRTVLEGKDLFKIATKLPLEDWDNAYEFFVRNFSLLLTIIKKNEVK